jgi:hypothetical protein
METPHVVIVVSLFDAQRHCFIPGDFLTNAAQLQGGLIAVSEALAPGH